MGIEVELSEGSKLTGTVGMFEESCNAMWTVFIYSKQQVGRLFLSFEEVGLESSDRETNEKLIIWFSLTCPKPHWAAHNVVHALNERNMRRL